MTTQWLKYWDSKESEKLDTLFSVNEGVAREILYQMNARKENVVAEIGCGRGDLISLIENSVSRLYGIDFSQNRIESIKSKATMLINDSFNIDLKDECIDRTFCFSLFNFLTLEESIATLEEMIRITRKGGFIFIGDILKDDFEKVFYLKLRELKISCPELSFYNARTYEKIINSVISSESNLVVYDTKIAGFVNDAMSFNALIWKK